MGSVASIALLIWVSCRKKKQLLIYELAVYIGIIMLLGTTYIFNFQSGGEYAILIPCRPDEQYFFLRMRTYVELCFLYYFLAQVSPHMRTYGTTVC